METSTKYNKDPRERGRSGEEMAVDYFLHQGYILKVRNYRTRTGEIDAIFEKGDLLVFVEVKLRDDCGRGAAEETITHAKQRRLIKAALQFIQQKRVRNRQFRFDAVFVKTQGIEHIENAFSSSRYYTF
jgi:putative endonuclease